MGLCKSKSLQGVRALGPTCIPYFFRRWLKLPTISATRAFMGATYTILKELVSTVPSLRRWCPICTAARDQHQLPLLCNP